MMTLSPNWKGVAVFIWIWWYCYVSPLLPWGLFLWILLSLWLSKSDIQAKFPTEIWKTVNNHIYPLFTSSQESGKGHNYLSFPRLLLQLHGLLGSVCIPESMEKHCSCRRYLSCQSQEKHKVTLTAHILEATCGFGCCLLFVLDFLPLF